MAMTHVCPIGAFGLGHRAKIFLFDFGESRPSSVIFLAINVMGSLKFANSYMMLLEKEVLRNFFLYFS